MATFTFNVSDYLMTTLPTGNPYVEAVIGGKMNVFIKKLKEEAIAADNTADENPVMQSMHQWKNMQNLY